MEYSMVMDSWRDGLNRHILFYTPARSNEAWKSSNGANCKIIYPLKISAFRVGPAAPAQTQGSSFLATRGLRDAIPLGLRTSAAFPTARNMEDGTVLFLQASHFCLR